MKTHLKHIITILVLLSVGLFSCLSEDSKHEVDSTEAYIIARQALEQCLKSPASAEFPFDPLNVIHPSKDTFEIHSYVDAQNEFGATLRNTWMVNLVYKGTGEWADINNWEIRTVILDNNIYLDKTGLQQKLEEALSTQSK